MSRPIIPFLFGFVLSFGALIVAGHLLPLLQPIEPFERFSRDIQPETHYYPTARQVEILAQSRARAGIVTVVIGGNSILRGVGQITGEEWSRALAAELGPRFSVLNLAANGSTMPGYGLYVARRLIASGRQVIFVVNMPTASRADGMAFYRYFYYDWLYRGFMTDPVVTDQAVEAALSESERGERIEFQIRSWVNVLTNAHDFWTSLGYCCLFTAWTPLTLDNPWMGRRQRPDSEANPLPPKNFLADLELELSISSSTATGASLVNLDEIRATLPTKLAKNTVFVVTGTSPYYISRLPQATQIDYADSIRLTLRDLRVVGFDAVGLTDATVDDFYDRSHLTAAGGRKLAEELAPAIRRLAVQRGYL